MRYAALIGVFLIGIAGARGEGERSLFASDEPFKAVLNAPISQAYSQKKQEKRL